MTGSLYIGEGPAPIYPSPLSTWASPAVGTVGFADAAIFSGKQSADGSDYGAVEAYIQNMSPTGTGDLVISPDDETSDQKYIDMGINGSEYDGTAMGWPYTLPYDGYLYVNPPASGPGGNFAIGVTGLTCQLQFFAGGTEESDIKMKVSPTAVTSYTVFLPQKAATISAPSYVEGGIYYDTTAHKLKVGGAAGWETVTSSA